jgi:uncharacterized membrane protein YcaP (DUF421 family)
VDTVIRAAVIYLELLIVFRISGKRSLAQVTTFDFILLLIIAETIQQALLGGDDSLANAFLLILTLVGIDIALSLIKDKSQTLEKLLDDVPLVLVEDGKPLQERLKKSRVDESEILTSARMNQGLESMDQIKYAVLERSGGISVIPKPKEAS